MLQRDFFRDVSRYFHRDGADEITLANLDATVTEDIVGGGDVKIEVWRRKVVEIVVREEAACH
jgi:hypothetical protein